MRVIGLMSGSSLDGIDLAACHFSQDENEIWHYTLAHSECIPLPETWINRLRNLPAQSAYIFWKTHVYFGHYLGDLVRHFNQKQQFNAELVGSHGHTIFHFPSQRLTAQIGDGAALACNSRLPVVCDLRSGDIAKGGQGAPIVPIADLHLFADYTFCLNLGGIANISVKTTSVQYFPAFDICACNALLNRFAQKMGADYDDKGNIAASGQINPMLLESLNQIDYYQQDFPKSLGNDWVQKLGDFIAENFSEIAPEDILRTLCEHIAIQIAAAITQVKQKFPLTASKSQQMLVTGGGAFNTFLTARIQAKSPDIPLHIPDDSIVKYKEAIAMAFMACLRWQGNENILASVSGAPKNSIGGAIYLP
ncbi:MAG: anhydro-N-acetylmuramic acid kinase [Chitinophagales bacterium]|nr:anhydro-N-acetylmuramic acid kinase [Bacteroidota bacterium]MCB9043494.1 anhydro-N-acetylmuramic acid kinase [Chitinophagales bacterium]